MAVVDVEIQQALACLGVIAEKRQLLGDASGDLKTALDTIISNWESTGVDQKSYVEGLRLQIEKMKELSAQLSSLDTMVKNYVEELKATSANSVY